MQSLQSRSPMLLMELVGPAGAGKTTLSRKLAARNDSIQIGQEIALRKGSQIPVILKSAAALLPLTYAAWQAGSRLTWDETKYLLYLEGWIRVLSQQASADRPLVLLDHGPVFKSASLHALGPAVFRDGTLDRWWRRTLGAWAFALDCVIWLDAPDPVLETRINARSQRHAVKGRTMAEVSGFLDRYRSSYEHILTLLKSISGITVLRYDTSRTPIGQITDEVLALGRNRLNESQSDGKLVGGNLMPRA